VPCDPFGLDEAMADRDDVRNGALAELPDFLCVHAQDGVGVGGEALGTDDVEAGIVLHLNGAGRIYRHLQLLVAQPDDRVLRTPAADRAALVTR
jgi:hypothetical protein